MGKIDAHSLRIKMMASYLHYLVTNRCTKAFIFDEIQNLNFPPKTNKSISMTSQHFFSISLLSIWSSGYDIYKTILSNVINDSKQIKTLKSTKERLLPNYVFTPRTITRLIYV